MAHSNNLEKGDQVSWGGGQPSGRIVNIVEEGTAKVTSKKVHTSGNVVTRNAKDGDPAVEITRDGVRIVLI
ncbi:hypothetical protein EV363DRAFT_1336914 [Boletus edulis]|nr:hypothetical protein EV363DRAFT_1336914 [Boletus edulis]